MYRNGYGVQNEIGIGLNFCSFKKKQTGLFFSKQYPNYTIGIFLAALVHHEQKIIVYYNFPNGYVLQQSQSTGTTR
jgi:hypothetical protein